MPKRRTSNRCPRCGGCGHDYRGVLTIIIVVLTFGTAYVKVLTGNADETLVPPWMAGIALSVVATYMQGRGAERMRAMTQDVTQRSEDK